MSSYLHFNYTYHFTVPTSQFCHRVKFSELGTPGNQCSWLLTLLLGGVLLPQNFGNLLSDSTVLHPRSLRFAYRHYFLPTLCYFQPCVTSSLITSTLM
jgi:hypothetical protein